MEDRRRNLIWKKMLKKFTNCRLVKGGKLVRDDLWVRKVNTEIRAATQGAWKVNILEFDSQVTIHSVSYLWMKEDKQRPIFDQQTRTATLMCFNGHEIALIYFTIVLPCGFLNQIPTSACPISLPNAIWCARFIGGPILNFDPNIPIRQPAYCIQLAHGELI